MISKTEEQQTRFSIDLISRPNLKFEVVNPPLFAYQDDTSIKKITTKQQKNATDRSYQANEAELHRLRQKKAWDIALAPAKQVPMQAFMMWMSGSGVQIFSVMMVYMLIKGAITGALSVHTTFQPFLPPQRPSDSGPPVYHLTSQKVAFVACQGLLLTLGLWKVNGMGLLPTRISDWVMYETRPANAIRASMQGLGVLVQQI